MIYSYVLWNKFFRPKSSKTNFNLHCDLNTSLPHAHATRNRKINPLQISMESFECRDRSAQNRQPVEKDHRTKISVAIFFFTKIW